MLDFPISTKSSAINRQPQKPNSAFADVVKKLGEPMIIQKVQVDSSQQASPLAEV